MCGDFAQMLFSQAKNLAEKAVKIFAHLIKKYTIV